MDRVHNGVSIYDGLDLSVDIHTILGYRSGDWVIQKID